MIYLYGVGPAHSGPVFPASAGVDGIAPVEALPAAGMLCWVSYVDRCEFADQLSEKMDDLDWLAAASVRHQQSVADVAAHTRILPARFGTVFLNYESLEADIRQRKSLLILALKRVANADEWGVKVFRARQAAAATVSARSGREYLTGKAAQLESQRRRKLDPGISSLAEALKAAAVETAGAGKVSGAQPDLEWSASFLVRRKALSAFQAILKRFAPNLAPARRIEVTGPWPPYSFVAGNGQ